MDYYRYSMVAKSVDGRVNVLRFDSLKAVNYWADEYRQSADIVSVDIIENDVPADFEPGVIYL